MTIWQKWLSDLGPVLAPYADTLGRVQGGFAAAYHDLSGDDFIFAADGDMGELTRRTADTLRRWHLTGHTSRLAALCARACEHFGVRSPDLMSGVMTAAMLGDVENNLPFHNNPHYLKVLLQTIRTIAVHNEIFKGTDRALNERRIAALLIAACIHDLGHDGLGNTIKGVHQPFRLEQQSFDMARPYLVAAGYADAQELEALKVMVLATDVSPLNDPASPMRQMKAAYRVHFMSDGKRLEKLNLSPELRALERGPMLTQMALILHEADIATSAGLTYEVSQYENAVFFEEIGVAGARPSHIVDFLNGVCQRQFMGNAAQKLYSANMARIYALAQQDAGHGDEPYPKPENSTFVTIGAADSLAPPTNGIH